MTALTQNSQKYLQLFEQNQHILTKESDAIFNQKREVAIEKFKELGGLQIHQFG